MNDAPRIGSWAPLVISQRAGVFSDRTVIGAADRIPSSPDELLDIMPACFAIPPLYALRYFVAQVADFNYDDGDQKIEHIPVSYIPRIPVAMRAELVRCVPPGDAAESDAYDRVVILPAAFVRLMILSVDDRQLPTPTWPVTFHAVGPGIRRARDVSNEKHVVVTPPLLEVPVPFANSSVVDAQAPLSPMTDCSDSADWASAPISVIPPIELGCPTHRGAPGCP